MRVQFFCCTSDRRIFLICVQVKTSNGISLSKGRKNFNIKPGDKLLVFADIEEGLWIATPEILDRIVEEATGMLRGKEPENEIGQSEG